MRILAASALVLVLGVQARGQQQPAPPRTENVALELLELEQEVDRTLLREAMLVLGRREMRPESERPNSDEHRRQDDASSASLMKFIAAKKEALTERSAELAKARSATNRARTLRNPNTNEGTGQDRQGLIEKMEEAQVEIQLLRLQAQSFQQPLNRAMEVLTAAELAASQDATQQVKVEEARKGYEKAKSRFVEVSKRLQPEQEKVGSMQQMTGMGSMGGMR